MKYEPRYGLTHSLPQSGSHQRSYAPGVRPNYQSHLRLRRLRFGSVQHAHHHNARRVDVHRQPA